jgi:cyclic dehypoxanthinyl futalosine synthase
MGITRQQALDCFASDDLIGTGLEADAVRRTLHPDGIVSYIIDFALERADAESASIDAELRRMVKLGATSVSFPGDSENSATLQDYESLFARIRREFPTMQLHGLSATRVLALARTAEVSLRDTLLRLRDAGLVLIGSNAILLADEIRRRVAPEKCSSAEWIHVHRTAHGLGLASTATMIFGVGETMSQRLDHLELLRRLQEETGGFTEFSPLVFQDNAGSSRGVPAEPTAVEYLKTLAISRLYLENIRNLQGSWATQGLKVLQMALRFGANDVGSVLLQDRFGKPGGATEEELRRIVREAGFEPVERNTLHSTTFVH